MNEEFPMLDEKDYQKNFLADWWSEKKLFIGSRNSGKTTMMLCEARRFQENGFDVLFLTGKQAMADYACDVYQRMFGEKPLFETASYHQVENGRVRGIMNDVIICDEFQEIDLQTVNRELMPMHPMFFRASACRSAMGRVHYLYDQDGSGFFDSVYEY